MTSCTRGNFELMKLQSGRANYDNLREFLKVKLVAVPPHYAHNLAHSTNVQSTLLKTLNENAKAATNITLGNNIRYSRKLLKVEIVAVPLPMRIRYGTLLM